MNINPINQPNWTSKVSSAANISQDGGGMGGGGGEDQSKQTEKIDEASFSNLTQNPDELDLLKNKSLIELIKDYINSIIEAVLSLFGIKKN